MSDEKNRSRLIADASGLVHMPYPIKAHTPEIRYFLSMWALTKQYGGQDATPFQYIIVTTSRPPDDLKPAICLQLEARPAKMLFGCLLKNLDSSTPHLFDDGD